MWSHTKYCTSFAEYLSAPNSDLLNRPRPQLGFISVTHGGRTLCNLILQTDPIVVGDSLPIMIDFTDAEIKTESVVLVVFGED